MAIVDNIRERLINWLGLGTTSNVVPTAVITGYNPEIWTDYTIIPPYTMTLHEKVYSWKRKGYIHLKTVFEYDKKYPTGVLQRMYPQEEVED